jgi:GH25 family lysozyme M1 (1,4-beta-N-acetylmuramidase)
VTGRHRVIKHPKRTGIIGGVAIIVAGAAAWAGFAATGGPASAASLPSSCSASTSSSSAADASAALRARAADVTPAAARARAAPAAGAGTASPTWGDAQGIDVSDLNFPATGTGAESTESDWFTLKSSGISFVSIKATEGDDYTDEPPYTDGSEFVGYHAATAAATAAGLDVMPSVFGNPHAGNGTAQCQADYAWQEISSASPAHGSSSLMLPVALDIEQDPYATVQGYAPTSGQVDLCYNQTAPGMANWISSFLTEMQKDSGKTPVIYTNPTFWAGCTGNSTNFTSYPFWLADYGPPGGSPPAVAGWNSPAFWQYTDDASVSGVDGDYAVTRDATVGVAVTPFQFTTLEPAAGQTAAFGATGLPPGLEINSSTGVISGTPAQEGGLFTVTVTMTPSGGTASSASLIWDVTDPITIPAQANQSTSVGSPVSITIAATDTNSGATQAYTAAGLPSGLAMNSTTGVISGWPATAGNYGVKVTDEDNAGASAATTFTLTVAAVADSGTTGVIHQWGGSNKCLDDPSSRTASGTAIDLSACTGKSNQSWTAVQDGTIRILGRCLAASGAHVLLYSCDGSIADQWRAGIDGSLVDVRYGTCLNGPSTAAANGTKPTLATCAPAKVNQHWNRPAAPIVGITARCLGDSSGTAELNNCGNYSAQHWTVAFNAQIVVQSSNCLTEGGATPGYPVTVTKCANAASQHWRLVAAGAIAVQIQSTASGLCVTVPGSGTVNDTHLTLGLCWKSLNTTWRVG